jgi:ATP-binding cassette subfamily B protein
MTAPTLAIGRNADRADAPAATPAKRRLELTALIRPQWKALTLALIAVLGETGADLLSPWPIKVVVDNLLQSKKLPPLLTHLIARVFGDDRLAVLNFAVAAVAVIAVVGAVSSYVEKYATTSASQWVAHDLRHVLYHHIQRLSLTEYDKTRTGDLISRVTTDIDGVQSFIEAVLVGTVVNVLTLLGMVGVMFLMNWRFTLIALSVTPVLFGVVFFYTRRIKKASRAVRKKGSELISVLQEVLTSMRVVKAFAREDYEEQRFDARSIDNVDTALKARSIKAKLTPIVEIIVAVGTCLVLWYGARLALAQQLSAGVLIVFLMYLGKMYKPMRELSKISDTASKATVGYERIQEVLAIESVVRDRRRAQPAPRFKGHIALERVNFSYDPKQPLLKDVSLRIEPGRVAAMVGPSGAGKSTLISLVPRFYDPQSGVVKIDGSDIRGFTMKSLRQQISFVLQDTILFRARVFENIAYGKPDASRDEIIRAAKVANAHAFIEAMPEGYDTMVGERGVSLSGGQRQRIAIARAVIRDTPILILDEPTSGLDPASEGEVIEALDRLMKGRSTIVIAHHLNTIRNADVIFVIADGGLAEHGTHDELLKRGGAYAELHRLQNPAGPNDKAHP